jgi:hypothetical protein
MLSVERQPHIWFSRSGCENNCGHGWNKFHTQREARPHDSQFALMPEENQITDSCLQAAGPVVQLPILTANADSGDVSRAPNYFLQSPTPSF